MGDPAQYAPGQQLPGTVYRVVRHLATGGMGSVYDVEDVTVGKRYVLKTLHPQLVSRHDLAKRMEVEARTLAKLQHPNIVDVVTAGLTTDPTPMPFYVMERLNGQNLRLVIEKKGSLELSHCYRIAIDVLDALEHAHENSVIHRDVKPENIFLHRNANGTTTTKLLDFGIIRLLDAKASHTQGKFIGTLRYASPEQIFGGDLGPATDIYSLGIVLYEMLAGRGPFDEVGDAYAIAAAHAQRPPPPLSQFAQVPPLLERVVMSSLAKNPAERPRDCFTFAGELRRLLRHEEAAPKSATAINVMSSAAPNTSASLPLAGTELSPSVAPSIAPSTAVGMVPPSMLAHPGPALPANGMEGLAATRRSSAGIAAPATLGMAATLASEPGVPPVRDLGPPARVSAAPPAPHAGAGQGAGHGGHAGQAPAHAGGLAVAQAGGGDPRVLVDRSAETHAANPAFGYTQRLAQNGTAIDDGVAPVAPPDAVRAALGQRELLDVPPSSGQHDHANRELVFPQSHAFATGTGPLSGEARTRPPEARGMLLPLIGAALFGAVLVGGALLYVTKPWQAPPPAAGAGVAEAPAQPTAPNATPAAGAAATATVATALATGPAPAPVVVPAIVPATTATATTATATTAILPATSATTRGPTPRTRPDPATPAPTPIGPRKTEKAAPRPDQVPYE